MVNLWSALMLGCLKWMRLRHVELTAIPSPTPSPEQRSSSSNGGGGSVPGYDRPGGAVVARTHVGAFRGTGVPTTSHVLVNLARGPSRDPSPA